MQKIDYAVINKVIQKAKSVERLRTIQNIHTDFADSIQRMISALEPGTYVQPHKHQNPDKREMFIILSGKALVVEYSDNGTITDHFILDQSIGHFLVDLAPRIYHQLIALESNTVIIEIKDGPYDPTEDKHFAQWAPAEGDSSAQSFLSNILNELGF
jgi:cupin fold WbuC family metalloprotein